MKKLKELNQQGFTIIEVMIVLVIAAVIILIVFLAVPALNRNSRNNQRKNDASRIASAITEFTNNNNGQFPVTADHQAVYDNVGKGSYYTTEPTWTTGNASNPDDPEKVTISLNAKCSATLGEAEAASGRRFVILYTVESGGGSAPACLDS